MQIYVVFQKKAGYVRPILPEEEKVFGPFTAIRLEHNILRVWKPITLNDEMNYTLAYYDGDRQRWITDGDRQWAAWYYSPRRHLKEPVAKQPKRQRVLLQEALDGS